MNKYIILLLLGMLFSVSLYTLIAHPAGHAPDVLSPSASIRLEDVSTSYTGVHIAIKEPRLVQFTDSKSMDPVIDTQSTGILVPASLESIHVGDIIVYAYGGRNIVHRVIEKYEYYLILKGDNLAQPDPVQVTQDMIVGKIVGVMY